MTPPSTIPGGGTGPRAPRYVPDTEGGDREKPRRRSSATRVVIGLALLIVLGPLLWVAVRREVARWYQAAARNALMGREPQQALGVLNHALSWDPHNLDLYFERAQARLNAGDAVGSLDDADQALKLARQRHAGNPSPVTRQQLASALNLSAYAHALSNTEIETSLEQINEAFELLQQLPIPEYLDTRGYLYFLAGDDDLALADIDAAVDLYESNYHRMLALHRQEAQLIVDRVGLEYKERLVRESMAVLYHHRGEVYAKLGRDQAAEKDLRRATELGYDPARGVW